MNIDSFTYLDQLRRLAAKFPEVTEGLCFGTPAFYVQKKLLARFWEDGETLVIRSEERDLWMKKSPDVFFITAHYQHYPSLLIHLSLVNPQDLLTLFKKAWECRASKKLVREYQARENQ